MNTLTPDAVDNIARNCLLTKAEFEALQARFGEITDDNFPDELIKTPCINAVYVWSKEKIIQHREAIRDLITQLPYEFLAVEEPEHNAGSGWSFLKACMTSEGEQWTGDHRAVETLFCLGMAAGFVTMLTPDREAWSALPGGMPYFCTHPSNEAGRE